MAAAVLNHGAGASAFSELATQLAVATWTEVATEPAEFNYVLYWDGPDLDDASFIPSVAVAIAGDKRLSSPVVL